MSASILASVSARGFQSGKSAFCTPRTEMFASFAISDCAIGRDAIQRWTLVLISFVVIMIRTMVRFHATVNNLPHYRSLASEAAVRIVNS